MEVVPWKYFLAKILYWFAWEDALLWIVLEKLMKLFCEYYLNPAQP